MPLRPVTNEELAYVAGLFDGEGCVNFGRVRGGGVFIRVMIVNSNKDVLEYVKSMFGGDIKGRKLKVEWKQTWTWRLGWSKAIEFLDLIQPWLIVKSDQAAIAFCWDHFRPGCGKHTPALVSERASINEYLKECLTYANKRGTHTLVDPVARELCRS